MPLYADRVQETTSTTGTGTVTLSGAATGFRTFASAFTVGDRIAYVIYAGTEWEVGDGTLVSSTTISRDNVHSSSNSNALVSFSSGFKAIWNDLPAQQIANVGLALAFKSFSVPQ